MLSNAKVEEWARRWQRLDALESRLETKRDFLKELILDAADRCGELAPKAKAMRVLHGVARELQVSYPVDTDISPVAVRRLLTQIPRGLGRRLFVRSEKFTLRPGADAVAVDELRTSAQLTLFALAVRRTPGSPRVKVVKVKKAKRAKRAA
jgi:hypothetical protein